MCDFDKEDAGDFIVDGESADWSDKVVFDGVMKLNTKHDIPMSVPVALGSGYVSESDKIDFANYHKINKLEML